jgi:hypothetical protein
MTDLAGQEKELFDRWRESLPVSERTKFVTDGAVDPTIFNRSAPKILLLLKEVNDPDGGGWCLREYLTAEEGHKRGIQ